MTDELTPDTVHVIIPALNEEMSLPSLLTSLASHTVNTIVVDNGSTDRTSEVARHHGATVVTEPRRGYGSACLAGLATLQSASDGDLIVFFDADGSDDPHILPRLLQPLLHDEADFVLASRTLVAAEPGALNWAQRFGNWLACGIILRTWGVRYTDLAPCRALRLDKLRELAMTDKDFGWTVQMQVRAAKASFRVVEVPSHYRRRRFDESKISGRLGPGLRAGVVILAVIGKELMSGGGRRAVGR